MIDIGYIRRFFLPALAKTAEGRINLGRSEMERSKGKLLTHYSMQNPGMQGAYATFLGGISELVLHTPIASACVNVTMRYERNNRMRMYTELLICLSLLFVAHTACRSSLSKVDTPDVGFPAEEMNTQIRLQAPQGWNTFKIGDSVNLAVEVIGSWLFWGLELTFRIVCSSMN